MFQKLSIIGILAAAAAAGGHFVLFALRTGGPDKSGSPLVKRMTLWERFILVVTFGSLLALAATGFFAAVQGVAMSGYLLMLHVTFAPPFILGLLATVATWAHDSRYESHDLTWVMRRGCLKCGRDLPAGRFDPPQKTYLWILAAAGIVLSLTAALSMVYLADTTWQGLLYEIHRYTALGLVVVTILHLYYCTLAKPGAWWVLLTGNVRLNWAKRYHPLWAKEFMPEEIVPSE
jgi:formate dehydrogenase gamma subunit